MQSRPGTELTAGSRPGPAASPQPNPARRSIEFSRATGRFESVSDRSERPVSGPRSPGVKPPTSGSRLSNAGRFRSGSSGRSSRRRHIVPNARGPAPASGSRPRAVDYYDRPGFEPVAAGCGRCFAGRFGPRYSREPRRWPPDSSRIGPHRYPDRSVLRSRSPSDVRITRWATTAPPANCDRVATGPSPGRL